MTGLESGWVYVLWCSFGQARDPSEMPMPCLSAPDSPTASPCPDEFPTLHSGLLGWQIRDLLNKVRLSRGCCRSLAMRINLSTWWKWECETTGGLIYVSWTFLWQEKLDFQKDSSSLQESQNMPFKIVSRCLAPLDCRVTALLKMHEAHIYIFRCLNLSSVLTLCPPELKNNSA